MSRELAWGSGWTHLQGTSRHFTVQVSGEVLPITSREGGKIMGNVNSTPLARSLRTLLKTKDIKLGERTIRDFFAHIHAIAPWFWRTGSLTLPSWEKLGRDIQFAEEEGIIDPLVRPIWEMVRSCLRSESCFGAAHGLSEVRKALDQARSESSKDGSVAGPGPASSDSDSDGERKGEQEPCPDKKKVTNKSRERSPSSLWGATAPRRTEGNPFRRLRQEMEGIRDDSEKGRYGLAEGGPLPDGGGDRAHPSAPPWDPPPEGGLGPAPPVSCSTARRGAFLSGPHMAAPPLRP